QGGGARSGEGQHRQARRVNSAAARESGYLRTAPGQSAVVEDRLLDSERQLSDARHDRVTTTHQLEGAQAQIAALTQQRNEADADFRRQALEELGKATQYAAEQRGELVKARQRAGLQTLRAPVSGTVEQLAVHTIGGVVTPAQTLM